MSEVLMRVASIDWCASRRTVSVIKAFCEAAFLAGFFRAFTEIEAVFFLTEDFCVVVFFGAAFLVTAFFVAVFLETTAFLAFVFLVFLTLKIISSVSLSLA
jgi:hypothetical protein